MIIFGKSQLFMKSRQRIKKTRTFARMLRCLPIKMFEAGPIVDDRDRVEEADMVWLDWPIKMPKPRVGLIQDQGPLPRWTKYRRFLENNSFPHEIYNIHTHDWLEKAARFDVVMGFPLDKIWWLQETRQKFHFLETYMGKFTYPSTAHINLYEDKLLEMYIAKSFDIPAAKSFISHDRKDAMEQLASLKYPLIAKIIPASGSVGVEMLKTPVQARRFVEQVFSNNGRKTHMAVFRQKDYVFFQEFIPNDGYDIRVIITGERAFGYYRKVLQGDFRASGMNQVEKRALPAEAVRIARQVNKIIRSPMLVVDFVHGLDDRYYVIEYSPICEMSKPEQLHVNDVPGSYIFDDDIEFHFEKGRWWVHELALREFFLNTYIPSMQNRIL